MTFAWLIILGVVLIFFVPTVRAGIIGAPWLPSRTIVVRKVFAELAVNGKDTVVDLGAGTGTVVLSAAARGARAIGFEMSPLLWLIAALRVALLHRAEMRYGNFYRTTFPAETTIVFLFLTPKTIERARRRVAQQQLPQLRAIISYTFQFPGVPPRRVVQVPRVGTAYVYNPEDLLGQA